MKERNTTFTVLSAIAMVLVMLGHLNFNVLTFGDLFPYYSYHVLIFVFISGYFYNPDNEQKVLAYILHKAKTLMLPYFIWNLVYGIIANLLHGAGFEIGEKLSIYNLLVAPFAGGHQFMYNAVSWFVPALFMLEVCNIAGRKILSVLKIKNEWLILAGYLLLGMFAIFMAIRGSVYDYYKIPGRIMVMAPILQMGRIYREKLERYDSLPSVVYIPLLFIINLLLVITQGGLNYSVVWVTGFANGPVVPYITAVTGIALWLRIARLVAEYISDDKHKLQTSAKVIKYFGENTYSVMMHQLIVFMAIKTVFYALSECKLVTDFDLLLYRTDIYYTYVPAGCEAFKWGYLFVGIAGSLLIGTACSRLCDSLKGRITKEQK